jgi:excisionase family DNA binding protein
MGSRDQDAARLGAIPSPSARIPDRGRRNHRIRFFKINEVAEFLGVAIRTVRRWIDSGDLVAHRFGGAIRIAEDDLLAFCARHREG